MTDEMTEPDPARVRLPLSFGQQQLWFLHQLKPDMASYNVHLGFRLTGRLDVDVLRRSLAVLLRRHESLRATFHAEDGVPYQVIRPPTDAALTVLDRTGHPAAERDAIVARELAAAAATPVDLTTGPLARFLLVRLADDDHALGIDHHHIVTDGWSGRVLNNELAAVYGALLAGTEPDLPEPRLRYRDFVADQLDRSRRGALARDLDFWQRRLVGLPVLELPADRARPLVPSFHGDAVTVDFDPAVVAGLRDFAERHGVSRYAVLAGALAIVLSRYTDQYDIPIGAPMHGRVDPDLEDVVGIFANMVVLRADLSGDPTFAELAGRIDDATLDMIDHQEAPFELVVERIKPAREPGRNPLFGVAMQVYAAATAATGLTLPGVSVTWLDAGSTQPMFDLNLNFFELADGMRAQLAYAGDLFDRWRIEALLGHLAEVLRVAPADPSVPLSRLSLLPQAEHDHVLAISRGAEVTPWAEPVHDVVARIAAGQPDALAAVCDAATLTYRELDRRADLLAGHLCADGIGPEQIVAIAMDRCLDVVIAMLAVWRAGAGFTVLDPRHPASRLDYMLRDTAAPLVITHTEFLDQLPPPDGWRTLALDTAWPAIEAADAIAPPGRATRDSLAYVLYTSGSTGQPKGVLIEHRALACFLQAYHDTFDFAPGDRLLQLPAITFDMSQGEIWAALTIGATLVLVSHADGQSPEALVALIREQRVTYAGLSPAMLSLLDAGPYPDLRCVMNGADALPAELVNKWNLPGRRFVNLYGPTEAAIACTEYVCEHVSWQTGPPIGRPEFNRLCYVVDRAGHLAPRGVPGELLIGGDEGLARGYLNQEELTSEKFVPDPFRPTGRVYRSGDLVRWTADWQLEFLGRIDNQVKLRGMRIEVGEIEAALLTHERVRMTTVLLRTDPRGDRHLVGYYAPRGEPAPSPAELRRHLEERLPDYMVPTAWVALSRFPLTAARKVDRKALPEPVFAPAGGDGSSAEPSTDTEKAIAEIVADVLGAEHVGADVSFFEIGGSSLQAMRAISRINKTFGIRANIRLLYGGTSVSAIATAIDDLVVARDHRQ